MKIILTATDDVLASVWEKHCGDLENVRVHRGSILDLDCDAVVSPANSFGFMDGGIDMAYSQHFGWRVQERLQSLIREKHHGELLVGLAEIVETGDAWILFLIPWNNNNAEYAIKQFSHYREGVEGTMVESGLNAYLALLSICVTCEYKRVKFLPFLQSKMLDIDEFARGIRPKRRTTALELYPKGFPHWGTSLGSVASSL
jgi:O-acetyl-ADP-ribose deacetylase (regulator of RNase III)